MLVKAIMTTGQNWLELENTTKDAEAQAFELEVYDIPLTDEGRYIGTLSLDVVTPEELERNQVLSGYIHDLEKYSVSENSFIYDTLKYFDEFDATSLPVVNQDGLLTGILRSTDVIAYLSKTVSVTNPGSFITLRLLTNGYNLQEISRIVESNNAQIISLHFEPIESASELHCTIKINKKDLKHIIATFERFDYELIAHSSNIDNELELKNRYHQLMKYLNI